MRILACLAAIAVFYTLSPSMAWARARVYRCVQPDRHISYQQIPCEEGSGPIDLDNSRSGWTALRNGEKELLRSYRNRDSRVHNRTVRRKTPERESKSCWKKRKQLEAVRSRLRRGYTLDESYELRRKRENYEDYLRQFCS